MNNKKKKIVFYPYEASDNEYIVIMRNILEEKAEIIDYRIAKLGLISLSHIQCIYLNWIENDWLFEDELFIRRAKKNKVKIIWVFHNKIPHDIKFDEIKRKKDVIRCIIECSTYIIIHSKSSRNYLLEYGEDLDNKIVFIPLVNYKNIYEDLGGDIRKKYGIEKKTILFGVFGMIRPYKNIELLIDIFKEKEFEKNKLIIIGKTTDFNYFKTLQIKAENTNNIIIRNKYISPIEMGSYLNAIDIMILPYNTISSMNSSAMILAFSYGKTVVISNIAMSDEYEEELIYKYKYQNTYEHYTALKKQLLKVIYDGREGVSNKGKKLELLVEKNNSLSIVKNAILKLI